MTQAGTSFFKESSTDLISRKFRELAKNVEIHRPGLGCYTLRRAFETIGGDSRDQVAVDHIMGHADGSMASVYRQRIEDDRLRAVAEHVREWLLAGSGAR